MDSQDIDSNVASGGRSLHLQQESVAGGTSTSSNLAQGKRTRQNLFCPHCDQKVSKTTFYRHKRCYYDSRSKRWATGKDREVISSDEDGSGQDIDTPPTPIVGATLACKLQ